LGQSSFMPCLLIIFRVVFTQHQELDEISQHIQIFFYHLVNLYFKLTLKNAIHALSI
jgi:hypothetical protein